MTFNSCNKISPNIVRVIKPRRLRWAGHVVRMKEGKSSLKILTCNATRKRPLGRPRRRWEDNIRMDLEENTENWIDILESPCECGNEPLGSISHEVCWLINFKLSEQYILKQKHRKMFYKQRR